MKNLIIGLDAADWDLMKPLLEKGKLPNIAKLMAEGSFGKLKSHITYGSPALWATIDTGKIPPKHGVKDFFTTTRNHLKSKRLFEILEPENGKVGLYKWYCTWPPKENGGFTIPSWLARSYEAFPKQYSFVTSLGKSTRASHLANIAFMCLKSGVRVVTLAEAIYEATKRKFKNNNLDKIIADNFINFKIQSDVYVHLLSKYKPNYSAYLIALVDSIGHRFWKFRSPQGYPEVKDWEIKKYGGMLDEAYILSDHYIGEILRLAEHIYDMNDMNIVLVSDHGQKAINEIDTWGYFPRTGSLLELLDLKKDVTATNIGNYIYIRPESPKYKLENIKRIFESVKTLSGKNVFLILNVENDDLLEIKINHLVPLEDDIIVDGTKRTKLSTFASRADRISGGHAEYGVMILRSKFVKKNYQTKQPYNIEDIAPTLLQLNDKPIGEDMDGRPIQEIFTDEFTKSRPVKFIRSYDGERPDKEYVDVRDEAETEEIKSKLKGLGYFS